MVVYKAFNLYQGWTESGPRGTVYDITPNGWFDSRTFQRWYFEVLLPHIHSMDSEGPFAVIGDNLGSHFSPEVIMSTIEEKSDSSHCHQMQLIFVNRWTCVFSVV